MTGVSRNTNREFTGCDILSPLKELCPQSLGRSLRCGYRVSEQMRVLLLHLVFAFPEAEYVALSASCAQVMWMRTQLKDYGFNYNKIPLYCDSQSAIAISCNPVQHSRTKDIHTRYYFIKE
ncbi:hypothetical protein Tco_1568577 [Tanacetum coccineum]